MNKNPLGVRDYVDELIECGSSLQTIIGKVEEDMGIGGKEFSALVNTCKELKTVLYVRFPYADKLLKPYEVGEPNKDPEMHAVTVGGNDTLAELREEATSMGIKGANLMKAETLKKKIAKMQVQVNESAAGNEEAEKNGEQESENVALDA